MENLFVPLTSIFDQESILLFSYRTKAIHLLCMVCTAMQEKPSILPKTIFSLKVPSALLNSPSSKSIFGGKIVRNETSSANDRSLHLLLIVQQVSVCRKLLHHFLCNVTRGIDWLPRSLREFRSNRSEGCSRSLSEQSVTLPGSVTLIQT